MKFLTGLFVFAAIIIPAISAAAVTSSNHPLYSLENVLTYVASQDAQALFTIEETESGTMFVRRDIVTRWRWCALGCYLLRVISNFACL